MLLRVQICKFNCFVILVLICRGLNLQVEIIEKILELNKTIVDDNWKDASEVLKEEELNRKNTKDAKIVSNRGTYNLKNDENLVEVSNAERRGTYSLLRSKLSTLGVENIENIQPGSRETFNIIKTDKPKSLLDPIVERRGTYNLDPKSFEMGAEVINEEKVDKINVTVCIQSDVVSNTSSHVKTKRLTMPASPKLATR